MAQHPRSMMILVHGHPGGSGGSGLAARSTSQTGYMARVGHSQAAVRVRMDGQWCHMASQTRRPTLLMSRRLAAMSMARTAGSRDALMCDAFRDEGIHRCVKRPDMSLGPSRVT